VLKTGPGFGWDRFFGENNCFTLCILAKYTKYGKYHHNNRAKSRKMVDNGKGIVYDLFIGSFPIE
jgi:hypothetical protein